MEAMLQSEPQSASSHRKMLETVGSGPSTSRLKSGISRPNPPDNQPKAPRPIKMATNIGAPGALKKARTQETGRTSTFL